MELERSQPKAPTPQGIALLPKSVQRRRAIEVASNHLSLVKPRSRKEQALEEILAFAEELLDWSYGGREARLDAMPYPEYLRTPEWDEKRRAAYRRANYRCQLCNASGEIQAHHRSYAKLAKAGEEDDLMVLCPTCHARFHAPFFNVN